MELYVIKEVSLCQDDLMLFLTVFYILFSRKITEAHMSLLDDLLRNNPELSSVDLVRDLHDLTGVDVSDGTIRRIRAQMGWTYAPVKYCQLIS